MKSPAPWSRSARVAVVLFALAACSDQSTTDPTASSDAAARPAALPGYVTVRLPNDFFPIAVNRNQTVVGLLIGAGQRTPARWTADGGATPLSVSAGWIFVEPTDINERGEIAGRAEIGGASYAVRWDALGGPRALAPMLYSAGSAINRKGRQIWIQELGTPTDPEGFDVRFWEDGREGSLGVLPIVGDGPSDATAQVRFKDDGTALWGYGWWVLDPRSGWTQYKFPLGIEPASLNDVNRHSEVVGVGYDLSLGRGKGYLWDRQLLVSELEDRFLPAVINSDGEIGGYRYSGDFEPPFQRALLRTRDGDFISLPEDAEEVPGGFFLAWGFTFDLTDSGDAIGLLIYQNGARIPFESIARNVLWTRRPPRVNVARSLGRSATPPEQAPSKGMICDRAGVSASAYCD